MRIMDIFDDQLEIFFGEATTTHARVYAQLPRGHWPTEAKLIGTLSGPTCLYAETLPTHYRFRGHRVTKESQFNDKILAEAVIPDPCFWTPQLPYLYELKLELRRDDEVLARTDRPFGVRPFGVRGSSFLYTGKRWVLRGRRTPIDAVDLSHCHQAEIAIATSNFDPTQAAEASRLGVLMAIEIGAMASTARQASCHAAVGMLIFDSRDGAEILPKTTNCILVQNMLHDPHADLHERTQAVLVDASHVREFVDRHGATIPIVAYRCSQSLELAETRSQCDQLQADLAEIGDFAGYLV
jgi:hypothetical protein